MRFFRVESSKNELDIDSSIKSSGRYSEYLQQEDEAAKLKCAIENMLDKLKGEILCNRRDYLFAFGELKDALIFSSNIYKGKAKIYSITSQPDSCTYKGDMNLIDLYNIIGVDNLDKNENKLLENLCKGYWMHCRTHSPCYEYLLKNATVESLVCSEEECIKFYKEYTCTESYSFLSVERSSVYQTKLKEFYTTNS